MNIVVTGSTGFIGEALVAALIGRGDHVVRLVRPGTKPSSGAVLGTTAVWDPPSGTLDPVVFEGCEAVIHLAGEGIGERRWTPAQKTRILESRTVGTGLLARVISELPQPPRVFLSGSAIGYYGNTNDTAVDETGTPGTDFAAEVCVAWEHAAAAARDANIRTTFLRTGLVLGVHGGVLKRMLLPFRMGLGGRSGTGRQWMSWVSLRDEVAAMLFLLDHDVPGPVNLTAPTPVTNRRFTHALGRALHRPAVLPTPKLPLYAKFGKELVDTLMYSSQRVVPAALLSHGFQFQDVTIEECFSHALNLAP